ncbi:serine phosphatase RsbU, regulator of sigma subunit [Xenococcus sp. PCC 7305]|uniref:SpoIIE family protein phosphatase n=1 Tax=Xenococcus sp. PCC 7305 TaxID=102125 RepID=UPI0002AC1BDE|nr:SpoIIE family protein phosphatase [Xenococcus sp. PCC 7305]ELS02567.1 serine phosphatase RsbU, regulator of sigma subunit [Xenococcus sp. PCC 7305]
MSTNKESKILSLSHLRHELRTPINAIIGYSEMLLEDLEMINDSQDFHELKHIRECGLKLTSLVSTLLNDSNLEIHQLDLEKLLTEQMVQNQIQIPVNSVISHCQQILKTTNNQSLVSDIQKINQASQSLIAMTSDMTGTAKKHSAIQVDDSFISTDNIPLIEKDLSSLTEKSSPNSNSIHFSQEKESIDNKNRSTILIVDDNATNLDLLSRYIINQGYKVARAANGKQALAMIQIEKYDLILLDVLMPGIDGYEVLQWIKNSSLSYIPVIMISALDEIDSVVKCIEMGAEDYLSKPFNAVILKARISACLEKKQLRDQEELFLNQLAQANQEITTLNKLLKAENNRLTTEIEVTQRLQQMILPKEKELRQIDDLEISGFMESADEVGGDYYDVLHDNGRVKIGIGDVTGHGLESGVLMLMVQTAVRTLVEIDEKDPKKFLEVLNRTIYKNIQRMNCDRNLTLCLVDYHNSVVSLSGQHEEIILIKSQGEIQRIDTMDLGFPIGLVDTIEQFVFQVQIKLDLGDTIVLYTDGITEAENPSGQQYGLERLCQLIKENHHKSASNIRKMVIDDLLMYIGEQKIYDDITLVVIKQI